MGSLSSIVACWYYRAYSNSSHHLPRDLLGAEARRRRHKLDSGLQSCGSVGVQKFQCLLFGKHQHSQRAISTSDTASAEKREQFDCFHRSSSLRKAIVEEITEGGFIVDEVLMQRSCLIAARDVTVAERVEGSSGDAKLTL